MNIKNTHAEYGLVAKLLHWLIALITFGLFGLGLWMTGLTYYDSWYVTGPRIHESIGVLLFFALLFRLLWRKINTRPSALSTHTQMEKIGAKLAHFSMNILLLVITISGYFIVTAKGDPLTVYGLFELPASITNNQANIDNLEDSAGKVHFYLAWAVIIIASLHALAAIKHHFIDKDKTLSRMLVHHEDH